MSAIYKDITRIKIEHLDGTTTEMVSDGHSDDNWESGFMTAVHGLTKNSQVWFLHDELFMGMTA